MTTSQHPLRNVDRLPAPDYTDKDQAQAVARTRRAKGILYRVLGRNIKTGDFFGYDLAYFDAKQMHNDLVFNSQTYDTVDFFKLDHTQTTSVIA